MNTNAISIRCHFLSRALGALSLLYVCGLTAATHADAQRTYYIQTTTAANRIGYWTDLSVQDSNPNRIYFVTPNWNPPGSGGVYNSHPTGVWFDAARGDWAIFNQDASQIPLGASFNVYGWQYAADAYTHIATAANSTGDYTILDSPYFNNDPNALVWVTPNWNPGGKGGVYNNHNIGVWYNNALGRWAIFNQDGSPIPHGAAFNVTYNSGPFAPYYYVHTATVSNSMSDYTVLDDSLINGANGHLLMVTPNWNPGGVGGVYLDHPIGVWYNSALKRYAVFNQDGSPMPRGASFNVWVIQ
jgi:hypothetical protein